MDLAALKAEAGKAAYVGKDDNEVAQLLNAQGVTVDADEVTGGQIAACLVRAEWSALDANDKSYLQCLCGAASIPVTPTLKTELGSLFAAGSKTRGNLVAAIRRRGSRAEELGFGIVTASDVANARRLE